MGFQDGVFTQANARRFPLCGLLYSRQVRARRIHQFDNGGSWDGASGGPSTQFGDPITRPSGFSCSG